jgi:hypothetical protein
MFSAILIGSLYFLKKAKLSGKSVLKFYAVCLFYVCSTFPSSLRPTSLFIVKDRDVFMLVVFYFIYIS